MAKELQVQVQGSAKNPYTCTFVKTFQGLRAYCDCQAGIHREKCKHRIGVMTGDDKVNIVSGEENVPTVQQWFKGSNLEKAINNAEKVDKKYQKNKKAYNKSVEKLEAFAFENPWDSQWEKAPPKELEKIANDLFNDALDMVYAKRERIEASTKVSDEMNEGLEKYL